MLSHYNAFLLVRIMTWYAVYETTNGRLVSVGQLLADPLPANLTSIELAGRPPDNQMWDEATHAFIARPPKVLVDRLLDILEHPNYADIANFYSNLSAANKTRFRNFLIKLLGVRRWRNQAETISLDGSPD